MKFLVVRTGAMASMAAVVVVVFWTGLASRASAPSEGRTIHVAAGGDLQKALDQANPGDTILLAAGATFVGNFVLPAKTGAEYVTLRTAASSEPAQGTRVGPQASGSLARLRSPGTAPALATAPGAHHWRIQDLEFLANRNGEGEIIRLGTGSQSAADTPRELVLERLLIRGDDTAGQKRGIALNSGTATVRDSYISGIGARGQDSQAICGWNGPGPFTIENNFLEAAGENVMFGGADPSVPGLVPGDIVIRGNHLTKRPDWYRGRRAVWVVKNLLELKNARRVLVEHNVLEHSWRSGQSGFAVLFHVRNQDGRSPWSVVEDITFQYNLVRHAGAAISIHGRDDSHPSGQTKDLRIRHNLIYDIDAERWGGNGRFLQIGDAPRDILIDHNTVLQTGTALYIYGLDRDPSAVVPGFTFTNNIVLHGEYGLIGEKGGGMGHPTIERYFPGGVVERNVLAGGSPSHYSGENYFPSVPELLSAFVNAGQHDYRLRDGSPFLRRGRDGARLGADVSTIMSRAAAVIDPAAEAAWLEARIPQ
ncbi:MAG TPA: hypothetical protein VD833_26705 [Vicinamibacterales bacterium]|nr:hypothetical protein [Vicinamibacterales bacterium]